MADGFFEANNFVPDDEDVDRIDYSGSDPKVMNKTLNGRIRMSREQMNDQCCTYTPEKIAKTGLIIREELN